MVDEQDFQRALDADPTDSHLRLVFADWLEEQGDSRALGYQALGIHEKNACNSYGSEKAGNFRWAPDEETCWFRSGRYEYEGHLWDDWFDLLRLWVAKDVTHTDWYCSRREAEDDAALAFLKLPAERQAELLAQPVLC